MDLLERAAALYRLEGYEFAEVPGHEGGRNSIFTCRKDGENRYILRVSMLQDRTEEDYLAETEFIRFLAMNGAPVADVIYSVNGKSAERISEDGQEGYACLFAYAKGMLLCDNGYRYREGAPLSEYFYNTGKALGAIHRISKAYNPVHRRADFFDKYNMAYIDRLIPDRYAELKQAIARRLEQYRKLPRDGEAYGLVHFDFCDGNYHVDLGTGDITAFDFDNCIYCWYMFDLAHLWTHGIGWFMQERDAAKRREGMEWYFKHILSGYRSETDVSEEELSRLPLYIDMTIIESVIDEFECAAREGEDVDPEDIEDEAECLINGIPYAGYFEE